MCLEDGHRTAQNHYYIYGWTKERTIGFFCFSSAIIWENSSISLGYGASIFLEGPGMHVDHGTIGWCLEALKSMSSRCRRGMPWILVSAICFPEMYLGRCYKYAQQFPPSEKLHQYVSMFQATQPCRCNVQLQLCHWFVWSYRTHSWSCCPWFKRHNHSF